MKRYKLDMSAEEFIGMVKGGFIGEKSNFEVYEVDEPAALNVAPKKKIVRKPRRTKAQIAADNATKNTPPPTEEPTEANRRAFPWKDPSMNTDAA
jgi:hypothetical protein